MLGALSQNRSCVGCDFFYCKIAIRRLRRKGSMAKRLQKKRNITQEISQALGAKKINLGAKNNSTRKHFSADEFIAWAESNIYRDDKFNGWTPLKYSSYQKKYIAKLLTLTDDGLLKYKTIMPCWCRRMGKSEFSVVYDIMRCIKFADQKVVMQANSSDQAQGTIFGEACKFIQNSPNLKKLTDTGAISVLSDVILFDNGSEIKFQPASEASTYGQKIHVYHHTEGCKARTQDIYDVGASSTGDAWCGVSIIDSNMGSATNMVYKFQQLAEAAENEAINAKNEKREIDLSVGDSSVACSYVSFENLNDVLKRGCGVGLEAGIEPIHPWIDANWMRGRAAQMIESEFLRNHCNLATGSGSAIWSAEQIDPLFSSQLPSIITPANFKFISTLLGSKKTLRFAIGAGLDRADAFSKNPDRSSLAVTARVIVPELVGQQMPFYDKFGEVITTQISDGSFYILLGIWDFMYQLRDPIQSKILQLDKIFNGKLKFSFESYQSSDLGEWCQTKRFGKNVAIEHMTQQGKKQLVEFVNGLIVTRRFLASNAYSILRAEFCNYREKSADGRLPTFKGKYQANFELDDYRPIKQFGIATGDSKPEKYKTWIKDDNLEAVFWSIKAASEAKLTTGKSIIIDKPLGL